MPIITRLSSGKKTPGRVNVYVDGKYAFSLSAEEIITHKIKKGKKLSSNDLHSLINSSHLERSLARAYNFLSYRPRSKQEIADRLKKYEDLNSNELIPATIRRLEDQELINDHEFALWFIKERIRHRPRSLKRLRHELYRKGIDSATINSALAESEYDEQEALESIIEVKIRKSHSLRNDKNKLITYLLSQGFPYNLIKPTLNNLSQV